MSARELHRVIRNALREYQATAQTVTLREYSQRDYLAEHLADTLHGAGWIPRAEVLREAAEEIRTARSLGHLILVDPEDVLDALATMSEDAGKDTRKGESTRAPETCGQCRRPFDAADTRFDGQARHHETPFCRGCVDRCHESTDVGHECPVCRATEAAPAARYERDRCIHGTSLNVECGGCDALGQIGGDAV
ncbi:hypothetical protein FCH28_09575 [Streptomyces piniterrae]|uniref:Uncharacterized protein n=1 Tax=Streptomyces piniterrae TaxID=2571125 RepID=A0A4U0NMD9_9ACTN|nr:hypothetical protein [Streptomyces piniterrae]TJZ55581.1 hypothetical protein FCH28_09575 [Streptomyces piniterrae]